MGNQLHILISFPFSSIFSCSCPCFINHSSPHQSHSLALGIEVLTATYSWSFISLSVDLQWMLLISNYYYHVVDVISIGDYGPSLRLKEGDDNVMFRNMNHEVRTIPFRGVERTLGCSRSTDQIVAAPFNSTAPLYAGLMVVENQATKHQLRFSSGAPSTYSQDNID